MPPETDHTLSSALTAHLADCAACQQTDVPVAQIHTVLHAYDVPLAATAVSQAVWPRLQQELARQAAAAFRSRVAVILGCALLPLPLVFLYSSWLLQVIYAALSVLFPPLLASYMVGSYALCLLFLYAFAYAAVPVLVDHERVHHEMPRMRYAP